jgi:hypothetical protein
VGRIGDVHPHPASQEVVHEAVFLLAEFLDLQLTHLNLLAKNGKPLDYAFLLEQAGQRSDYTTKIS